MRQLLVPACVCFVTLSGSIGNDPKLLPGQIGGANTPAAETSGLDSNEGSIETWAQTVDIAIAAEDNTLSSAALIDAPIAIPAQSDSAPVSMQIEPPPLPKRKPPIRPVIFRSTEEVCSTLTKAALHNDLPVPFFIQLLFQESRFSPGVVSNAGALGIAQFMPDTATDMGVDNPFDPLEAIPASARLLRNLFEKFGNLGLAAAAYNAGPKRIQDWLEKKGLLPQETQGYVKTITGRPAEDWTANENGTPAVKLPRHAPCQDTAGLLAWDGPEQIPVPAVAPHRRPKEPIVTAAAASSHAKAADGMAEKTAETKGALKTNSRSGDASAPVKVAADPAATKPKHASTATATRDHHGKKEASGKDPSKKDAVKKDGKDALQLTARKQRKNVRISER